MDYYIYRGKLYKIENNQISSFSVFSDKYTGWVTTIVENSQKISQEKRIMDIRSKGKLVEDIDKEIEKYKMMEGLKS